MIKNIEKLRHKGILIKDEWLNHALYSINSPPAKLKELGLKITGDKIKKRKQSMTTSKKGPSVVNAGSVQNTINQSLNITSTPTKGFSNN